MPRKIEMQGRRFGRLEVLSEVGRSVKGDATWLCRCDCGTEKAISGGNIRAGKSTSCGCFRLERLRAKVTRHGMRHTRVYNVWLCMVQRCTNVLNPAYPDYGGRGIRVCDRWRDFRDFYTDMGDPPDGLSIDRINVDGNYELANCRWATNKVQACNTRQTRRITFGGKTQSLVEWSDELGIEYWTLHARFRRGWNIEKALTTPVGRTA